MRARPKRRSNERMPRTPRLRPMADSGVPPLSSPTAVAAEALRTGVLLSARPRTDEIPSEDETIRVGDPDDHVLANEYVGEETPGGTTPTPDQSNVDDIGRAYGLQEEDTGSLRSAGEVLARRDRHRFELQAPRRPAT